MIRYGMVIITEWVLIFLRSTIPETILHGSVWRLRRSLFLTLGQYLLWVLYRMYNLFYFFSLHSLFSRSLVDPFFVGLNAGLKCEWTHSEAEKSSPDQRMFMFSNFVYHFKFCGINI